MVKPYKSLLCIFLFIYKSGMPLGLFKKVGNYCWTGGLGAEPPAGSRGSALVGVQAPLKLELFLNQNCPESHQLTRMVVTHVYNTCTGEWKKEGKKKKKKKRKKKKVVRSEKVGIPTKVGKTASLINTLHKFSWLCRESSSDYLFS